MKNQFVTYEIAKKLKELGFEEPCLAFFQVEQNLEPCFRLNDDIAGLWTDDSVSAPLWQQAIDWLREENNIYIYINPFDEVLNFKPCVLFKWAIKDYGVSSTFCAYTHARETVVLKSLDLLIKRRSDKNGTSTKVSDIHNEQKSK